MILGKIFSGRLDDNSDFVVVNRVRPTDCPFVDGARHPSSASVTQALDHFVFIIISDVLLQESLKIEVGLVQAGIVGKF